MKRLISFLLVVVLALAALPTALAAQVTVTVNKTGNGDVTVVVTPADTAVAATTLNATGNAEVGDGDSGYTVKVTATPHASNKFKSITLDGTAADGSAVSAAALNSGATSAALSGNVTVNVVFEEDVTPSYTITLNTAEGGTATVSTTTAFEGTSIQLTATESEGYRFTKWIIDGAAAAGETVPITTFSMPAKNVTVTPEFKKLHRLSFTQPTGGTIVTKDASLIEGETIDIEIVPTAGYLFDLWVSSAGGSFASATSKTTVFTMPDNDIVMTAKMSQDPAAAPQKPAAPQAPANEEYALTTDVPGGGGRITVSQNRVTEGTEVNIRATSESGYKFAGWSSLGGGTFADASEANTTYTMPGNAATITAEFKKSGSLLWVFILAGIIAALAGAFFIVRAKNPALIERLLGKLRGLLKKKKGDGGNGSAAPIAPPAPQQSAPPAYSAPPAQQQGVQPAPQYRTAPGPNAPQNRGYGPNKLMGSEDTTVFLTRPISAVRGDGMPQQPYQQRPQQPAQPQQRGAVPTTGQTAAQRPAAQPPQQPAPRPMQPTPQTRMPNAPQTPQARPAQQPAAPPKQAERQQTPNKSVSDAELLSRDVKADPFYDNKDRNFFDF